MGKQHYKNGRAFNKPYDCLSRQQRWRRKLHERQQDLDRPDEEPSCSTSTVNIRTNDLIREDIPCVASDECAEIHHDSHSDESETLDEYSVEEVTENPNVAENQNCSPEANTVCEILVDWALTEPNVPKQAISRLCKNLNCVFPEVLCSYSGLIGQPQLNYARMCNGEYCHFPNWMESLKSLLMFHFNSCTGGAVNYYLLVNCDGLPLFRHSLDYKLYPILVSLFGISMRPLCAGVYCTEQSKQREMPHPAIFLKRFLEDIQSLLDRPLEDGNVTFVLQNKGIYVCDAPARASLKCTGCFTIVETKRLGTNPGF